MLNIVATTLTVLLVLAAAYGTGILILMLFKKRKQ
jgi:hypothetical protein